MNKILCARLDPDSEHHLQELAKIFSLNQSQLTRILINWAARRFRLSTSGTLTDDLLTIEEAAHEAGVSVAKIKQLIDERMLTPYPVNGQIFLRLFEIMHWCIADDINTYGTGID